MAHRSESAIRATRGAALALCLTLVPPVSAGGDLLSIMRNLDEHFTVLTRALTREDWDRVHHAAQAIAGHPKLDLGERLSLLGRLGSDASRFREHHRSMSAAARDVAEAAAAEDIPGISRGYHRLLNTCLDCHSGFRDRLRD